MQSGNRKKFDHQIAVECNLRRSKKPNNAACLIFDSKQFIVEEGDFIKKARFF